MTDDLLPSLLLNARIQTQLSCARVEPMAMPLTPQIELWLINGDFPQHALSQEEMLAVMDDPPYWAFCWASGQVLARTLLSRPELCRGKRVLDFGSGSGVVAIAAALAGAREVVACDIDPQALLATRCNAAHNGVNVDVVGGLQSISGSFDLVVASDVLYDRDNLHWLEQFNRLAPEVLVGESRLKQFEAPGYERIAVCESSTLPDFDNLDEFKTVTVYRSRS